jgi:hypothetical protein
MSGKPGEFMEEQHKPHVADPKAVSRRELVRKGVKAAYVVPVVLAAVSTTERPAFAGRSDM